MKIKVILFAALREATGMDRYELDIPQGSTAEQAAIKLAESFPKIAPHLTSISFAVDNEFVPASFGLNSPCELALIPPVSGG